MPRYIRDLIDLPEQVHRGDFVLRLTEGVEHPAETVDSYVVTPQLVEAFDKLSQGQEFRKAGEFPDGHFSFGYRHVLLGNCIIANHDKKKEDKDKNGRLVVFHRC